MTSTNPVASTRWCGTNHCSADISATIAHASFIPGKNSVFACLQVDGKSSVACYLMALDKCYASLCEKFERCRSNFERQRRLARSSSGSAKSSAGKAQT